MPHARVRVKLFFFNYSTSAFSCHIFLSFLMQHCSCALSRCCTLRSWVHEMFSHYRTVTPRLGDNSLSKCSSNSFSHTKYMSSCVENSQNHTLMFCCSPIPRRRFEKRRKLWDRFVSQFFTIS